MFRRSSLLLAFALLAVVQTAQPAGAQENRRLFSTPGLILETRARIGSADALLFTANGKHLLACGDDKVVRVWAVNNGIIDPGSLKNLRWSIFRETRGNIHAMALSPDKEQRYVAVGGYGIYTGAVAVLDRFTGEVAHGMPRNLNPTNATIWSMAFSPAGDHLAYGTDDGSVWLWNFKAKPAVKPRRLGQHTNARKDAYNYVRLVAFISDTTALSVAEDGQVARWNVNQTDAQPTELFRFKSSKLSRAAISPDRRWVAGANQGRDKELRLEVRSLPDGTIRREPQLLGDDLANCLAFDARGEKLAVGCRRVPDDAWFFKIVPSSVYVYDLRQARPTPVQGPKTSYYPEAIAFHPDGVHLAVAGGDNFEVFLADLRQPNAITSTIRGPGSSLWQVGLTRDGRHLGFRDQRRPDPPHPNERADGPWRVFDLERRAWAGAVPFQPIEPISTAGGWTVQPSVPGQPKNAFQWYVVGPDKKTHRLPLDPDRDSMPLCWTFLPVTAGTPVQLAVGHSWGFSVFDLDKQGVRRRRLAVGHAGQVTAIAPGGSGKIVVTASRDQTICGWSLADWPSEPELGATFSLEMNKLIVDRVDAGSPAWEAGLNRGDEVVLFAFAGKQVGGGPAKWLDILRKPVPGVEHYFRVKRAGQAGTVDMLTTVRQRPLWQFFPMRNREWVLWRWRDYYYDCSSNGDSYIGWQLNGDVDKTPEFFEAERFRRRFHRPDKVADVIDKMSIAPERVAIPEMSPPEVQIAVASQPGDKVTVDVTVKPRDNSAAFVEQPSEVSVWINDYRFHQWVPSGTGTAQKQVVVPWDRLRRGTNQIIAQAYNHAGARGDSRRLAVVNDQPAPRPTLYGLIVGISDYSKASRGAKGEFWPNLLYSRDDAQSIADILEKQKPAKLYADVKLSLLLEEKATADAIRANLQAIARAAQPDDRLVLFLAGHGYARSTGKTTVQPGSFAFVTPRFDFSRPLETGLSSKNLFDALAVIPCRKLVLLDACHSYGGSDLTRELSPSKVGPIIISACDANEFAHELPQFGHGLFTQAILEASSDKFTQADRNQDARLNTDELFDYISTRLPAMIQLGQSVLGKDSVRPQTPRLFAGQAEETGLPVVGQR